MLMYQFLTKMFKDFNSKFVAGNKILENTALQKKKTSLSMRIAVETELNEIYKCLVKQTFQRPFMCFFINNLYL